MRNTPWYHQRRSESAPPAERVKEAPKITQQEQDDMVSRISRPTESARYRQSLFWKLDGYMDKGFHSWSRMELFDDCKQCMWTPSGSIKNSCKIRPVKVLPPLLRSDGRESTSVSSADINNTNKSSVTGNTLGISNNPGSVCTTSRSERCDSRRAVLRPRPLERSRTNVVASRPFRSSAQHNAARLFLMRQYGNGGGVSADFSSSKNGGGSSMAVPRMNVSSATITPLMRN